MLLNYLVFFQRNFFLINFSKMIDFGKLYCDLHPNEIITNFCFKETCMVGLCATCICTHTQYHICNKTTPQYQNIRVTFSSMHDTIRRKISSLQGQKNRIDKISEFILTKRKTVKQNIEQTKKQAISAIHTFFENKQKSMLRQMESQQKKMGLHSQSRMESLMNSLNRQTACLITSAQQLNSQNFLQSYQRIKTQTITNATKLQEEISKQLDRNQDFQTIINSNDEYIHNMIRSLDQSLHLSFKMNPRPLKVKNQKNQSILNGSNINGADRVTSRFSQLDKNMSVPITISKPLSGNDYSTFSTMSFSNVPEMLKQPTGKFKEERQTSKSIPFEQQNQQVQRPSSGIEKRSFINDLSRSDIIKETSIQSVIQSQIFRQRDSNQRPLHQSLNKFSEGRNHQSQLIVNQKPFGYQSGMNWNQGRVSHQQGINYSMVQNLQNSLTEKQNPNMSSQLSYSSNKPSSLPMNQYKLMQPNMQMGQKFNITPQMFESNQFKSNENHASMNQCKKVRKSGLTLLKANQANSTSRSRLHAQ